MSLISGFIQNYPWGKSSTDSIIASYYRSISKPFDPNQTFAELWLGTHVNGPSTIKCDTSGKDIPFSDHIQQDLPFLMKVLSINSALSLQAHPDAQLAKQLHDSDPTNYKDPHHKPELVIALTPMHVLDGFRSVRDIHFFAQHVPEFRQILGDSIQDLERALNSTDGDSVRLAIKTAFSHVMHSESVFTRTLCDSFSTHNSYLKGKYEANLKDPSFHLRSNKKNNGRPGSESEDSIDENEGVSLCSFEDVKALVYSLMQQYPGDVGVFGPFFMNYFTLRPHESVFLGPNEPHAYLFGECIEAMACSDNVVRVGLTPKFRDVDTLTSMLTYSSVPPTVTSGVVHASSTPTVEHRVFAPPPTFPEFMIIKSIIKPTSHSTTSLDTLHTLPTVSIVLVSGGKGGEIIIDQKPISVRPGHSLYIPSNAEVLVKGDMTIFRCTANQPLLPIRMQL